MKSKYSICIAITLFSVLALPVSLAADGQRVRPKHHHYQLIDVGTFGGPSNDQIHHGFLWEVDRSQISGT